jgi:GxxExxY protein
MAEEILCRDECYPVQGAVFEVYREMGCGFLEAVYQECLAREFARRGVSFTAQRELNLYYKGEASRHVYSPYFICFYVIIVELKACASTTGAHKAQVLNYLKATGLRLGLLVNFGGYPKATVERLVR